MLKYKRKYKEQLQTNIMETTISIVVSIILVLHSAGTKLINTDVQVYFLFFLFFTN